MRVLAAALLVLMASGAFAEARPRDDAMAGAYRCSSLASTRVWLDCYYGTAQPVRAQFGLAPAPQAQIQLSARADHSGPAKSAQDWAVRDQVMIDAARCSRVVGGRDWLACYYAAANPARRLLGLPISAAQIGSSRGRERGFFDQVLGIKDFHQTVRMAGFSFDRHGMFTVTLANGQVWHQLAGDSTAAHWRTPASRYVVTITGGAFGSYHMSVKGNAAVFKVHPAS